jgi:hypothetical protein
MHQVIRADMVLLLASLPAAARPHGTDMCPSESVSGVMEVRWSEHFSCSNR